MGIDDSDTLHIQHSDFSVSRQLYISDARDFTCQNSTFNSFPIYSSRAILVEGSTMNLETSTFSDFFDSEGGALYIKNSNATLSANFFSSNKAQ